MIADYLYSLYKMDSTQLLLFIGIILLVMMMISSNKRSFRGCFGGTGARPITTAEGTTYRESEQQRQQREAKERRAKTWGQQQDDGSSHTETVDQLNREIENKKKELKKLNSELPILTNQHNKAVQDKKYSSMTSLSRRITHVKGDIGTLNKAITDMEKNLERRRNHEETVTSKAYKRGVPQRRGAEAFNDPTRHQP